MKATEAVKMRELMAWINQDFREWKETCGQPDGLVWSSDEPTEKDYCTQRLGVAYETFNRWKNMRNPASDINVLKVALSTRSTAPLEIWGFDPVPSDLWDILVKLPDLSEQARADIVAKLGAEERQQLIDCRA